MRPRIEVSLEPRELDAIVRESIQKNRGATRESQSQLALDRAVEQLYDEGELELAAIVLHCMVGRIVGDQHGILQTLLQRAIDLRYDRYNRG